MAAAHDRDFDPTSCLIGWKQHLFVIIAGKRGVHGLLLLHNRLFFTESCPQAASVTSKGLEICRSMRDKEKEEIKWYAA